jgi:hypothetical protein
MKSVLAIVVLGSSLLAMSPSLRAADAEVKQADTKQMAEYKNCDKKKDKSA